MQVQKGSRMDMCMAQAGITTSISRYGKLPKAVAGNQQGNQEK
jgi:hypothetical protein